MNSVPSNAVEQLRARLAAALAERDEYRRDLEQAREQLSESERRLLTTEHQLAVLRRAMFGRSSEKVTEEDLRQGRLFNEAEEHAESAPDPSTEQPEQTPVRAHSRTKRGRKPIPANLPRVEQIVDIPETEKTCACGHELVRIGEEVHERIEMIPARYYVRRIVRPKYACHHCEGSADEEKPAVRIAQAVGSVIPKGIAGDTLLALIIVTKYCDAMPLYRQERSFARQGIEISRADMANWIIAVAAACVHVLAAMIDEVRAGPVVGADESVLQVLKEKDRSAESESRMWVFRGGRDADRPVVWFRYEPTRSSEVVLDALHSFTGILQSDGFGAYMTAVAKLAIRHAGCWAHVRRKFYELSVGKHPSPAALEALAMIQKLYRVEKDLREQEPPLSEQEFVVQRREQATPILDAFNKWLDKQQRQVVPTSTLGQAVAYAASMWPILSTYLESARLTPDNNPVEREIRPYVIGRRNWLFSDTAKGAEASATLYSILRTAISNGHDPYRYMYHLLYSLPRTAPADQHRLAPHVISPEETMNPFDAAPSALTGVGAK